MRCLECNHLVNKDAKACPYCGGNVLTPADRTVDTSFSKHARRIWDQTDPAANVIPMPVAPRVLTPLDFCVAVSIWGCCWLGMALGLGVVQHWLTWVGLMIAVTAHGVVLELTESPALWRWFWQRRRAAADARAATDHDLASGM